MLSLYRRHVSTCGKSSRRERRGSCPIWVQGPLGGEKIRKALDPSAWDAAEKVVHGWREAGKIGAEGRKLVLVSEAVEAPSCAMRLHA
jgi:hypothetical protein